MKATKVVGLCSAILASNLCLITTNVCAQATNPSDTQVTQNYSEEKDLVLNPLDPLKTVQSEENGLEEDQEISPEGASSQTTSENLTASSENEETEQKEAETIETSETESSSSSETSDTTEKQAEEKAQTDSSKTKETGNEKATATATGTADPEIVLADWDITVTGSTATINKYVGPVNITRAKRVIPTLEDLQALDPMKYAQCTEVFIEKIAINRAAAFTDNSTNILRVSSNGSKVKYAGDSMEKICSNRRYLKVLDLNNLDVSNVTNMNNAFSDLNYIKEIGISTWDTSSVKDMSNMFAGSSLEVLYIPNLRTNGANTTHMFSGTTYAGGRFLVVTDDPHLLNEYKFTQTPALLNISSGDGQYPDGTTGIKKYFNTVAVDSKQGSLDAINRWMQENQPLRAGYEFAGWELNFTNPWTIAPGKDLFAITNSTYKPTWKKVTEPNVPGKSIKPNPDSKENLALAYLPKSFNIPTTQLQESGQQSIPLENGSGFHIGVKDQNSGSTWQLNAQLVWNTPGIEGSYIQSKNTNGQVYKNNNNGQSPVQESDFTPISEVTGTANLQIGTGAEVCVMQVNQNVPSGVYDFALGDAELVIPEVAQVQANQYAGQVNWNLVKAP
ncbi:BspA family leucine-rich repeat surface protein [Enterococcus hirae]|nr:BspA family leucine-rich repeat surface protein [Enterococcus hirae]EMF0298698.1 BspA family leucine-rich repeat surface protein [Enterococcus hirae]